ncbi:S1C family serine protease [Microbacterium sp. CFBP9034]|uniref:S1C family serine protease n=1 Tax=Microbacterium sp. CFBP9034 TaxID=3096540 RepID=UPI002A6A6B94|nr:trypsin-like peptidase domain-containing protein [Microbacterium sp. CFBP9034]MDY0909332.1 trypsin-like peptidase domain-containing protein [Microbacterium sp. CFBP9034]
MSDIQGTGPADSIPTDATAAGTPDVAPPTAEQAPAAPQTAPAATPAAAPPAPTTPAWQAAQPQAPSQPTPPAGYPAHQQAYARPQGYAGQPAAYPQSYAGQPQGAAFGVRPGDTQTTTPLGQAPATGATRTASKKSGTGKVVGLIVAAAIVSGAAGLGGAYAGVNLFSPVGTVPAAGPATVTVNDTESVNQTTAIAAKVLPSVVTIEATSSSGSGTGSGAVLTEDGYVVTNTHVVTLDGAAGDAAIRVTTSDGRVFDAEVVGTDPTYDLAVIKLQDATDLTPIEFADSSELNVGDATIAVGAPLGLANTVTTGIVSALNRSIEIASSAAPDSGDADSGEGDQGDQGEGDTQAPPFLFDYGQEQAPTQATESIKIAVIQTDAAINPGNSGGALVDSEGRLIGINVAIATAGGSSGQSGSIGVGFSIPSDIVQRITDEIIADGAATHGLLGANVLSAALVEGSTMTGAYIDEAVDGGAAAEAGLQKGDIVTAFNGVPVTDSVDLTAQVRAAAAGSEATVTFVRDGESQTVDVTLGTLEP